MAVRQRARSTRGLPFSARANANRPIILLVMPLLLLPSFLLSTNQSLLLSPVSPGDAYGIATAPIYVTRSLSSISSAQAIISSGTGRASSTTQAQEDNLSKLPLSFEPNGGQASSSVRFLAHSSQATFYFSPFQVDLNMRSGTANGNASQTATEMEVLSKAANLPTAQAPLLPQTAVSMRFLDANPEASIAGGTPLPGKVNYFVGNDPSKWKTGLPTYADIVYTNLYNGVDLHYSGVDGRMKGTYTLAPIADPTAIRWRYDLYGHPYGDDLTYVRRGNTQIAQVQVNLDEKGNLLIHQPSQPSPISQLNKIGQAPASPTHNDIPIISLFFAPLRLLTPLERQETGSVAMSGLSPITGQASIASTTARASWGENSGGSSANTKTNTNDADQVIWTEHAPVAWQMIDGKQVAVSVRYVIDADGTVSFGVGSYDHSRSLIIDPTLAFSTYLGGGGDDSGGGIAVDNAGNVYITGETDSANFPKANPYQPNIGGGNDAFISKMNASGSALIYSTYLGGSNQDWGTGIAVDASGNVYVTGVTASTNFPTANPFQPALHGVQDAFVAKLDASGSTLIYSTYLGGSGDEAAAGIAVDGAGDAYVTGYTSSISPSDFPTVRAFQQTSGGINDAFVTKLAPSGSTLIYSTYLGGGEDDYGNAIAIDSSGNAYVTGDTDSTDFPLANPFQSRYAGGDAFVTKLAQAGSDPVHLVYSTYLGGSNADYGNGIAVDSVGCAYITGYTASPDFPVAHPIAVHQVDNTNHDVFVTKLDPSGNGLVYSTFLGGPQDDRGGHIVVDPQGSAYVAGYTQSDTFPSIDAVQPHYGGGLEDAFVTKVNPVGSNWTYSTFLGGGTTDSAGCGSDCGGGIAVDGQGGAYVTGLTFSTNFPTINALQANNAGSLDAFVSKISDTPCVPNFADVHAQDWFYQYVKYLYCRGVISGYNTIPPCGQGATPCFAPNNPTTRGQLAKMVVLAYGALGLPINTSGGPHFADVPPNQPGDPYGLRYQYIETLHNMGVVDGYACGELGEPCDPQHRPYFRPNALVSRGQIAKIVVSVAVQMDPAHWQLQNPPTNTFQDVPVGSTFFRYVETAYAHTIINGYPCGVRPAGVCIPPSNKPYFLPGNNATRAQFSKVNYLAINIPSPEGAGPPHSKAYK